MTNALLEIQHLSKTFPGVRALTDVSLTVTEGEIVALLGHNGSGKSTLVKVLAGVHHPDDGSVINVPAPDAPGHHGGLHFIHQDLGLVPTLSTIENIDLGSALRGRSVRPNRVRAERALAAQMLGRFGAHFDVRVPVSRLSPAERTIVAIARALNAWSTDRNVLVLDEPTAALHGDEVIKLFDAVKALAADGTGIVFISHRLEEVVELADRVVVLRDGRVVANQARGEFDQASLTELIAGGAAATEQRVAVKVTTGVRLSLDRLSGPDIDAISLDVRAGEIVGISGLVGSGSETLAGCIFGSVSRTAGTVTVDGHPIPANDPRGAVRAGIALVPADRRRHGAVVSMSARENLTLPRLSTLRRAFGRLDGRAERREARTWFSDVGILPAGAVDRTFGLFSGGNQQKIVVAKWLRNQPKVLLLEEPTQGVDVGAQAGIYELIARAAKSGAAVLVASSDTQELSLLCDRVVVLRDGVAAAELSGSQLSEGALVRANLSRSTAGPLDRGTGEGEQ